MIIPLPDVDPIPGNGEEPSQIFRSPDGTRAVWVRGWDRDAFLYDLTETPAFEAKWMDYDVIDAKFWMDEQTNSILDIELHRGDDESSWFDRDGDALGPDGATAQPGGLAPVRSIDTDLSATKKFVGSLNSNGAAALLR